jgi:hypothetical protein
MGEGARFLVAVWLALAATASAQDAAAPGVTGSSGRFRAFGPDSGQNLQLVAWAEHLGLQVEEWIGVPLRWTGSESILFRCRPAVTGELARFTLRETPGGLAAAEIEVIGFATLDQEDLQEELARLLVHRMVGGRAGAAPPAWFTTGVAQLVTPSTRERDFADVLRRWREGKEDRVADVLGWHRLPRGRWGGKASAAAVVAWLADQTNFSALQAAMFERWRSGVPVTAEWLSGRLPGMQGEADLEKAFDLWLLARADDPVFVGWTAHILGRLRDTLKPSPQFIRAGAGAVPRVCRRAVDARRHAGSNSPAESAPCRAARRIHHRCARLPVVPGSRVVRRACPHGCHGAAGLRPRFGGLVRAAGQGAVPAECV